MGRSACADIFFGIASEQEGSTHALLELFHKKEGWTGDPYEAARTDNEDWEELERVVACHIEGLELDYYVNSENPRHYLMVSGTRHSFSWEEPGEVGPDLFDTPIPPELLKKLTEWSEELAGFTKPCWCLVCSYM